MSIFDDIASGADRLRRGEDALIWAMRARGQDWREIGTTLLMRRAQMTERCLALLSRTQRANEAARRTRDQIRQERARG